MTHLTNYLVDIAYINEEQIDKIKSSQSEMVYIYIYVDVWCYVFILFQIMKKNKQSVNGQNKEDESSISTKSCPFTLELKYYAS